MLSYNDVFLFSVCSILAFGSALLSALNVVEVAWFSLAAACITSLALIRSIHGTWFNLSILFVSFFGLYSLSGAFEVIFGSGELPPFYPPYHTSTWLLANSLALFGFLLGLLLNGRRIIARSCLAADMNLAQSAIGLILAASVGEIINLLRAGGLPILLAGKAVYQGAVTQLVMTIPSAVLALVSFGFFGLFLGNTKEWKDNRRIAVIFLISSTPLLAIHITLGQRLELASYILALLLGFTYRRPVKRISWRLVVVPLLLYVAAVPIYALRWAFPLVISGQPVPIDAREALQSMIAAINPARNEFGAPFGNFSTYLNDGSHNLRFGITYLRDLTIAIPGFLFPGEKPVSTTREFRDTYFPEWATRSPIAGTAFSNVLEAYMNFGLFGIPVVFSFYGGLLGALERIKTESNSVYLAVLYTSFSQFVLSVHRTSTGGLISGYFWISALLVVVYFIAVLRASRPYNTPSSLQKGRSVR